MRTMMAVIAAGVGLAGCMNAGGRVGDAVAGGRVATAMLRTAEGKDVGRATVREVAGGLRVTIDGRFLPPGTHGAHLHAVGRCDAPVQVSVPAFVSAGAHWNPGETKHGAMNPAGPHAGDLPNLVVGADGRGTLGINLAGASFDALLDADGASLVIHDMTDDLMTDPSGNSGARIACGVLMPG